MQETKRARLSIPELKGLIEAADTSLLSKQSRVLESAIEKMRMMIARLERAAEERRATRR